MLTRLRFAFAGVVARLLGAAFARGAVGSVSFFTALLAITLGLSSALLLRLLTDQNERRTVYELSDRDKRQLARRHTVRTVGGEIRVSVPDADEDEDTAQETSTEIVGEEIGRAHV